MRPPGTRLRALAARLFAASTMERLVDPAIADLQAEYEEALRSGPKWRSRWIWFVGAPRVLQDARRARPPADHGPR